MRKSSLRRTTLLSLLGLSSSASAQSTSSYSWGTPFSVDTPSTSTDNLLSSNPPLEPSAPASSVLTTDAAPTTNVASASDLTQLTGTRSPESTNVLPSSSFSFTVTLPSPTGTGTTVSTPISQSVTVVSGSQTPSGSGTETGTAAGASSTGGAGAVYVRMGFAGAVAGAAGVFMA